MGSVVFGWFTFFGLGVRVGGFCVRFWFILERLGRVVAPDFLRNVVRAWMPSLVPKITRGVIVLDTFLRMFLCWLYLVQSLKISSLVWSNERTLSNHTRLDL